MGSLTSRPKVPPRVQQVSQPVFYNVPSSPVAAPVVVAQNSNDLAEQDTGEVAINDSEISDESVQTQARESGLLSRRRGRFSTVLTGFRGILSKTVSPNQRKSLLGE